MDNYQVIFNAMGYDFDIISTFYDDLGNDFITEYEPFVGMRHFPSAVDYNIVTIITEVMDEVGPNIVYFSILGALKASLYIAKKALKYKNRRDEKTTPEIEINYNNYNIYISNFDEDSFADEMEDRLAKIIEDKIRNYDIEQSYVHEDQFYVSVFKHDNKDINQSETEIDNENESK